VTAGTEFDPAFDAAHFRSVIGSFASGVTVVTALDDAGPIGLTCQSFFSVSLDPPLIALSVAKTSQSWPRIRDAGRFAVNILAADQQALARQMARAGTDKWAGVRWTTGTHGSPVIDGAAAVVECDVDAEHPAGDHLLVLGRVRALSHELSHRPLLFFRSTFGELAG
jgi:3-hydroxy-9,10-secoandrosta-1,3,5(10)-triene-9,17-dione monooxygenase reductase component